MKYYELNNEIMNRKDGFFDLEKDKEAVKEFEKEVKRKTMKFQDKLEQIKWLVDNDYYYNVFEEYTEEQVLTVFELTKSYGFKFDSFMAVQKFYKEYALKTNDKKQYLESYEDRISIVSLYLSRGNFTEANGLARSMIEQRYQPATPTFLNAGKSRRGEMVSCFLLEMDDSLNSINFNLSTSMQLSKLGGGVAINLSKVRARGEDIKGIADAASGVLPVMKLLEDAFSYANQLGQRKGAGAAYLNIFHWDVIEFLQTKKINADEKSRIQTLSIGLIVPHKFFDLAKRNEDFYMFAPYSVYKEYGIHLDDMDIDEMYDQLVKNKKVKKKAMKAREMLNMIAQIQMESGYPYMMFKTNANEQHALKDIGDIKMSNLCTEIMQLQETSVINDYGTEDIINRDISCNLGSLNVVNVMEHKAIKDTVHVAMRALSNVAEMTQIENAPSVKKANEELNSVGLGILNLQGFYAKNKIPYESDDAIDFIRTFAMTMNYHSIEASMEIAIDRGRSFKDFEKSEYAKGTYFEKYYEEDFSPRREKVQKLFEGIFVPTPEDWKRLAEQVKVNGLFNGYRLATAPTGSISYIQNATSSASPAVDQIEIRTNSKSTTYYPMPYLAPDNLFFYKSAYHVNQFKMLDLYAEMQKHVDQGISTILYIDSNTSTRELARYYIYAEMKGLKSLYYTRTKRLSVEECTSCAV